MVIGIVEGNCSQFVNLLTEANLTKLLSIRTELIMLQLIEFKMSFNLIIDWSDIIKHYSGCKNNYAKYKWYL